MVIMLKYKDMDDAVRSIRNLSGKLWDYANSLQSDVSNGIDNLGYSSGNLASAKSDVDGKIILLRTHATNADTILGYIENLKNTAIEQDGLVATLINDNISQLFGEHPEMRKVKTGLRGVISVALLTLICPAAGAVAGIITFGKELTDFVKSTDAYSDFQAWYRLQGGKEMIDDICDIVVSVATAALAIAKTIEIGAALVAGSIFCGPVLGAIALVASAVVATIAVTNALVNMSRTLKARKEENRVKAQQLRNTNTLSDIFRTTDFKNPEANRLSYLYAKGIELTNSGAQLCVALYDLGGAVDKFLSKSNVKKAFTEALKDEDGHVVGRKYTRKSITDGYKALKSNQKVDGRFKYTIKEQMCHYVTDGIKNEFTAYAKDPVGHFVEKRKAQWESGWKYTEDTIRPSEKNYYRVDSGLKYGNSLFENIFKTAKSAGNIKAYASGDKNFLDFFNENIISPVFGDILGKETSGLINKTGVGAIPANTVDKIVSNFTSTNVDIDQRYASTRSSSPVDLILDKYYHGSSASDMTNSAFGLKEGVIQDGFGLVGEALKPAYTIPDRPQPPNGAEYREQSLQNIHDHNVPSYAGSAQHPYGPIMVDYPENRDQFSGFLAEFAQHPHGPMMVDYPERRNPSPVDVLRFAQQPSLIFCSKSCI